MSRSSEYADYCREDVAVGVPTRFEYCPFCNRKIKSNGLVVFRRNDGWTLYCHRCGATKFIRKYGVSSPSALLRAVNALPTHFNEETYSIYLPEDFDVNLPPSAKKWLIKYGVTEDEAKRYRFGYSAMMNRLILPVFNNEKLVFWQARRLSESDAGPKYISMRAKNNNCWFSLIPEGATEVVLVEDIISAIVLRRAGFNTLALLGSYVGQKKTGPTSQKSNRLIKHLQKIGIKRICVWLDPDKRTEAVRFARRLTAFGFNASAITTATKDPKECTIAEIRKLLKLSGCKDAQDAPSITL